MKAITCRYLSATTHRGARIVAHDADGNRVVIPYPYERSDEASYRVAAEALCAKMHWRGRLVGGATRDGYVFVFSAGSLLPPARVD